VFTFINVEHQGRDVTSAQVTMNEIIAPARCAGSRTRCGLIQFLLMFVNAVRFSTVGYNVYAIA
jgi:hypothetical protein